MNGLATNFDFLFWIIIFCLGAYFYLKITKKEITLLKVLGLGLLCYLIIIIPLLLIILI